MGRGDLWVLDREPLVRFIGCCVLGGEASGLVETFVWCGKVAAAVRRTCDSHCGSQCEIGKEMPHTQNNPATRSGGRSGGTPEISKLTSVSFGLMNGAEFAGSS